MAVRRPLRRVLFSAVVLAVLAVCAYASRTTWLPWLVAPLIYSDRPSPADTVVTLAGDLDGRRLSTSAKLVAAGYAPLVIVSGPAMFGSHECEFAIEQAVRSGFPRQWFIPLPHESHSTWEESHVILDALRRRNVHRFILVTSNYHTARARRLFLRAEHDMGGGPEMIVVASPEPNFTPEGWWRVREGRKIFLDEWLKNFAAFLHI